MPRNQLNTNNLYDLIPAHARLHGRTPTYCDAIIQEALPYFCVPVEWLGPHFWAENAVRQTFNICESVFPKTQIAFPEGKAIKNQG